MPPLSEPLASLPLFPEITPRRTGYLQLDALHAMYWEESGNPNGIPVVFLHGGPGAGAGPQHRRFFDPAAYRVIVFDQRGAGRSLPFGELRDNTTPLLIADIESLRRHLDVDRWVVFGGSWGSTLALAYAEAHPDSCLGLILRGIFLCRPIEIDWFLYGLRHIFPDQWELFAGHIPAAERNDLLHAYHRRLTHPDPAVHLPAARVWGSYEGACSTLLPNPGTVSHYAGDSVALSLARIEAHYFVNNIFLPENSLLDGVGRIRHLPAYIVQGRYDAVCPAMSAHDLHLAWPEAHYTVVPDAGHAAFEPGIRSGLVRATEEMKRLLPAA
ncbi:MAG: prolyl aminopeptidase [Pseudomonadota bacterium]|nr:prolyl aminopeptidase [Pseudomonadota bacterium]